MKRPVLNLLMAFALLVVPAGLAAAQVTLRGAQAGGMTAGGVTGATVGATTTPTLKDSTLPSKTPLATAEARGLTAMLTAQNDARARLGLPGLVWSPDLATAADATVKAASAGACTMDVVMKLGSTRGASIYWSPGIRRFSGADMVQDIAASYPVTRWREGKNDYDLASGTCHAGGWQCEPYSRMVAPKAKFVGCAKITCPSQAQVFACQYSE